MSSDASSKQVAGANAPTSDTSEMPRGVHAKPTTEAQTRSPESRKTEASRGAHAKPTPKPPEQAPEPKEPKEPKEPAEKPLNKGQILSSFTRKESASNEVVVDFDHVTKRYDLFKNDVGRFFGCFGVRIPGLYQKSVCANDDLTFKIHKGEGVAFLGHNGAGKSTVLKMVTGVSQPTSGTITTKGRISAMLELSAGFNKQLTGRENLYLRGKILGYSREQLKELIPKIVEFSELGIYIDQPIGTYSSGMKSRLGFGFVVFSDPDILIIDEALSVGDRSFQNKCLTHLKKIIETENVTVLFVTHSPGTAKRFCNRGIVLDHGKMIFDGSIDKAMDEYNAHNK